MAYIYKITNDINDKVYIGKTNLNIKKRFTQHCTDAFKEKNEKRPLYRAMQKYGVEHFHISLIEETDPNEILHNQTDVILARPTQYHHNCNIQHRLLQCQKPILLK